ncbi:hypothetical protein ACRS52_21285 [Bacillus cytotoxicus]|uniref:Sporulation protein Cse60 n=1 Tax=Bacillus cytotoxicus TaxID=580165 RepID=A0AAX2CNX3_9BACI|nr:hypothetical protein [Bacillus cytotoxicus]SCM08647.1 Protein of unknown function [Bacillus cytotoxicus]
MKRIVDTKLVSVRESKEDFQIELNKMVEKLNKENLVFDIQFSTNTEDRVIEKRYVDVNVTVYNALITIYDK